jgi:arginine N-succinyltransferase
MLTIRPIRHDDAAAFRALHRHCDDAAARALIDESLQALEGDGAMPQRFVFALLGGDALLGVATLAGTSGIDLPRHSYRTGVVVHASAELRLFNRAETLLLGNDHTGNAELTLPLMASADSAQAPQRLLIDAMLMFVALHPDRFAANLLAALPGTRFGRGGSPFWSALGRHFHVGGLPEHDPFFPDARTSHIARLMPKHPLYASFLGPDAQACIGRRALHARAADEALRAQGFRWRGHVDVFDAGPILEVEVADLHVARASRVLALRIVDASRLAHTRCGLIAATAGSSFRAGLAQLVLDEGAACVDTDSAAALGLDDGMRVNVLMQGA